MPKRGKVSSKNRTKRQLQESPVLGPKIRSAWCCRVQFTSLGSGLWSHTHAHHSGSPHLTSSLLDGVPQSQLEACTADSHLIPYSTQVLCPTEHQRTVFVPAEMTWKLLRISDSYGESGGARKTIATLVSNKSQSNSRCLHPTTSRCKWPEVGVCVCVCRGIQQGSAMTTEQSSPCISQYSQGTTGPHEHHVQSRDGGQNGADTG